LEWLSNLASVEIDFADQPEDDEEWLDDVTTMFSSVSLL